MKPRIRKKLKMIWGIHPEFSMWGQNLMEVRSKIMNTKSFSWKIKLKKKFPSF